jgi:hypothetical protein
MFDVQVARYRSGTAPGPVLASIAAYYARVTTAARPMNRLVAAVMLATVAGIVVQLAKDDLPAWAGWCSLLLALGPVTLARTHTVPSAIRLGARKDSPECQGQLARAVFKDHVVCIAAIAALLALQLSFA